MPSFSADFMSTFDIPEPQREMTLSLDLHITSSSKVSSPAIKPLTPGSSLIISCLVSFLPNGLLITSKPASVSLSMGDGSKAAKDDGPINTFCFMDYPLYSKGKAKISFLTLTSLSLQGGHENSADTFVSIPATNAMHFHCGNGKDISKKGLMEYRDFFHMFF